MNLDSTSKILEIILGEAMVSTNCNITTSYADSTASGFALHSSALNSNGTTPVTVVAAPASGAQRQVKEVRLFNNDSVTHTVTLFLFDGSNSWIVGPGKQSIPPNQSFVYTPESGAQGPPGAVGATGPSGPQGPTGPVRFSHSAAWLPGANPNNGYVALIEQTQTVTAIVGNAEVLNGTASTVSVVRAPSGTLLSAGTLLHSGSFNANISAGTNQTLTLSGTPVLNAGDRIGFQSTGTFSASQGGITVFTSG